VNLCACNCGTHTHKEYALGHHPNSRAAVATNFARQGHRNKGKTRSLETRRKLSEKMNGRKLTESPTNKTIHKRLKMIHPKTGICEECSRPRQDEQAFHYAFKFHPAPYTENRDDYRELCPQCHVQDNIRQGVYIKEVAA
jgi:hypothetical protein